MVILIVLVVAILQYVLLRKFSHIRYIQNLVTALVLCLYIHVFPTFLTDVLTDGKEIKCGLPTMGIYLGFWMFGGATAITIYLVQIVKVQSGN
ncbi:hypothetical protein [Mangrovimonas sp. YM274]|uniref:hypothetical protein n=1 Tax=Mangrovimonas sp. YM274 TaxID=3070660 RepID=UPI0027DC638E|nr:hypothetical protein [Mangrovimonas sp. YM274]WMI70232.1 hypothetical protein RBH95_07735 [Mangrovimonas sp. YM274]